MLVSGVFVIANCMSLAILKIYIYMYIYNNEGLKFHSNLTAHDGGQDCLKAMYQGGIKKAVLDKFLSHFAA